MAWVKTEKHRSGRRGLKNLPMNLLPQFEALRIDFFLAIGEIKFGLNDEPSRHVDQEKG